MLTDEGEHTVSCPIMRGRYRDVMCDGSGHPVLDSGWSSNTIVSTAWRLIAGLLANGRRLRGIQFWAVGAGSPEWDHRHVAADPETSRLHEEIHRLPISPEQIIYLDANASEVPKPTNRIEVRSSFTWSERDQTLREFGLFGGNASRARNRGYLISYVIHPRIDLTAGSTLTRRLRLSLHPEIGPQWLEVPQHWLGGSPVQKLDGLGDAYATALASARIVTIGDLASAEPTTLSVDLPLMKLVELRAKARLTLRTAADLSPVSRLLDRTAWQIIATPAATLAADVSASEEAVQRLREQMSALQLALDNQFLQSVTIGELVQPL